jgi:hypothetical protein
VPIAFAFLQPAVVASDGIEFLLGCKFSVYDPAVLHTMCDQKCDGRFAGCGSVGLTKCDTVG